MPMTIFFRDLFIVSRRPRRIPPRRYMSQQLGCNVFGDETFNGELIPVPSYDR